MDVSASPVSETISIIDGFTLDVATDRGATYDTLLFQGRPVADVEARIVEVQFGLPDGSMMVMLNDDAPFKEILTILLIGPALTVVDRMQVGGAFTPGYLTYAYPIGPDEIAFCWHDLDQVVTVRRFPRWFGLASGWLKVREVAIQPPRPARAPGQTLSGAVSAAIRLPRLRRVRRGRAIPALVWLAWLSVRTMKFGRKEAGRGRGPKW